ncbi:uncharacterized protein Z519_11791 [Cladophialophora bantiana CBS 173.52]|uniref:Uncharacterized protein n=1 Tax=Cladophialophora bantiana (strain ATCC 10958 / CBS 173.52 / CDC B-1940 / NIH 8579) TaxID=1442370 RepID=A0A0D2H2E1_CLAB1|nr:uncharacterized protein Z519_11791 [Cladophialophora bantiana CBS 173.52]KIW87468.1 hypothetical protein Z519_11791 [Cladophialophora bantiana CBS 173.52]
MRNKPQTLWAAEVIQATKVAPTIWPLVFAAVVGSMLKAKAHERAQHGTTIGVLEQLLGSQTVFGAMKSAYILRLFGLSTLCLFLLWSLNPVGGQAVLRAITLEPTFAEENVDIKYMVSDPRVTPWYEAFQGASSYTMYRPLVSTLFGAALFSPDAALQYSNGTSSGSSFANIVAQLGGIDSAITRSTTDSWGNVRIPALHLLPAFNPADPQRWIEVPTDEIPPYESIIGVPLRQLPSRGVGNLSFTLETNYHVLHCSDWIILSGANETAWFQQFGPTYQLYNASESPFSMISTGFFFATPEMNSDRSQIFQDNDTASSADARQILFGSRGYGSTPEQDITDSLTVCNLTMQYLEVEISCSRHTDNGQLACVATAVRASQLPHISSNLTEFDYVPSEMYLKLDAISLIFGSQHVTTSTPQEVFMYDPTTAFTSEALLEYAVTMHEIPIEVFEKRLALVFNTFLRSTIAPPIITGGSIDNTYQDKSIMTKTSASWRYVTPQVYRLHIGWLVPYLAAVVVLCACAIVTIAVRFWLQVPEVLGNVSTLTRDSPFINTESAASVLEGDERGRLLKDYWIRLQDIQPEAPFGRIAFSSDKSISMFPLQKERLYL